MIGKKRSFHTVIYDASNSGSIGGQGRNFGCSKKYLQH